jgi:hypothetical protein
MNDNFNNESTLDLPFTVKESELKGIELIVAGKYPAEIIECTCNKAKSGGQYILVRYKIFGDYEKGRIVTQFINIVNENKDAEAIGHRALKELMQAANVAEMARTNALLTKLVMVVVGQKQDKRDGAMVNFVKSVSAYTGNSVASFAPRSNAIPMANPNSFKQPDDESLPF